MWEFKILYISLTYVLVQLFVLAVHFIATSQALYCLSCTDVIQPRLCHQVETCTEGEVCAVQKIQYRNGEVLYKVGCESAHLCHSSPPPLIHRSTISGDVSQICMDCCTGDLCNAEGCGQPGYPTDMGPVCFGCSMAYSPGSCGRLQFCSEDEMCSIQEKRDLITYYETGCEKTHLCTSLEMSAPSLIGKRDRAERSNFCNRCCRDRLCNKDCDSHTAITTTSVPVTSNTTLPHTSPDSGTLPPTSPDVGTCQDRPECSSLDSNVICADRHAAEAICPRMCGMCCQDTSNLCGYLKVNVDSLCSNQAMIHHLGCLSTCHMCGDIMTGATCGAGDAHSSGTPDLTFGFCEGPSPHPVNTTPAKSTTTTPTVPTTTTAEMTTTESPCDNGLQHHLTGDNKGTEFFTMVFDLVTLHKFTHSQKPYLSIISDQVGGNCLSITSTGSTFVKLKKGGNVMEIPEDFILTDAIMAQYDQQANTSVYHVNRDVEMKCFFFRCSHAVAAVVVQKGEIQGKVFIYEAHLALSYPQCSTSFVVSSFHNPKYEYNVISVVATEDADVTFYNNKINVDPFNGTSTLNISLPANGIFQLASLADLSGTKLSSTKPVCVLSGNNCLYGENNHCSMVIESIPPASDLETVFVVPILMTNYTMAVKIVAAHDNTLITMTMTNQSMNPVFLKSPDEQISILNSGDYILKELGHMIDITIRSSKGVLVTQIPTGYGPFGVTVPAISQYKHRYNFDSLEAKERYITVIIADTRNASSPIDDLLLDNQPLTRPLLSYNTTLACEDYFVYTYAILPGIHEIHTKMAVPFGLIVHGSQYGYPGGMKFRTAI